MTDWTARARGLLAAAVTAGALWASAGPAAAEGIAPEPPAARKGETCVADVDVMRRNHMDFLKHTRDETMHRGVRDTRFSLQGCMDCHAVEAEPGSGEPHHGRFVTAESDKHFCNACHEFAGVSTDCFHCHASTPADGVAEMTEGAQ